MVAIVLVQWSYSLDKPDTGSLFHISWTTDSTQLAAGCANGQVMFAHVVDRSAILCMYDVANITRGFGEYVICQFETQEIMD